MGRHSRYEGLLIDKVKERLRNYRVRDESIIYIHNLDKPVWYSFHKEKEEKYINGYTIIGELVHCGLHKLLCEAREQCREIWLPRGFPQLLDRRVGERFIHWQDSNPYVIICGSADAFIELNGTEYPVELKTTRRNLSNYLPEPWLRRPKLYAWLYRKRIGYLIVINLVTGEERDIEVRAYSDEEVERIIRKWLLGKWPSKTLQTFK